MSATERHFRSGGTSSSSEVAGDKRGCHGGGVFAGRETRGIIWTQRETAACSISSRGMQGARQTVVKNSRDQPVARLALACTRTSLSTSSRGSVNYHLSRATPLRNQFLCSRTEFQNFSGFPLLPTCNRAPIPSAPPAPPPCPAPRFST